MRWIDKAGDLQIERLKLGPFETNSYILTCAQTGDSMLIDAPAEAFKILKALKGVRPSSILITHHHMDHIGALSELKVKLNIPIGIHRLDAERLPLKPEIFLEDGEDVCLGNIRLKVLHTPGHTPGSLCFLVGKHLFSGDTIFPGGPGKTESPNNFKLIIDSLIHKIFVLPEETTIYPGHGEITVLKKEKEEFEIFSSRSHDSHLFGDVFWLLS